MQTVTIPENVSPVGIFGPADASLKAIEKGLPGVDIAPSDQKIAITGPDADVEIAASLLRELVSLARLGTPLEPEEVSHAIALLKKHQAVPAESLTAAVLSSRGRSVRPRTEGQREYAQAMEEATVIFGLGPAGTGKTYLAIAKAVQKLLDGQVRRIIVTRPAVEAGESLGYLPGSLTEKVDPYLRPVYDALGDMLEAETLSEFREAGTIEVAPLAYMRGRTLNDAFIILDEAQNTTALQMKMFLTRLGFNSTMVITGDSSQVDLPAGKKSGLRDAEEVLQGLNGIRFCHFTSADVVRNSLVGDIIDAYERRESQDVRHGYGH
ncbi:MAG: PhoH family protein [Actinomycetaceae bacterium]|nr:PhoH family protein [Actinomycetaceae bacterium]